ncbi:MAG TPA: hypothetical protein VF658_07790 [Pyrinomonadaceae bacterium]|jgi:hypothetical protein
MLSCTLRFLAPSAIAVLLLCAGLPCRAFSQSADNSERAQKEEQAARKFDEFEELRGQCDLGARLDNLAIQLQAEPGSKGFIIVYSGKYNLPERVSYYRKYMGDYLVNSRGIDAERLVILDGGHRQVLTTQLWIAAKGASAPEPIDTIDVKQELDRAFKFEEYQMYLTDNSEQFSEETETVDEAEAEAVAGEVPAEQPVEAQEETAEAHAQPEEAQPEETQEASAESKELEEAFESNVWWASKEYARALEVEAKAGGLIIFYADREYADFSRMKEIVERGKTRLIEKYGVKAERLTMTFGGYRESAAVELWLVPANASLPLPTPDPEKQEKTNEQAKADGQAN